MQIRLGIVEEEEKNRIKNGKNESLYHNVTPHKREFFWLHNLEKFFFF